MSDIASTAIVNGTLYVLIGFSVATWALILIRRRCNGRD